ncbi:hypothetical protein PBI_ACHEBE_72 [Mycobacterium phage Achebe]|uniref:Uncharacterized protein n=3 Tax=Backyardiganvirus TaxID=2946815 RepID=A0A6B9LEB8_9CAUD|nr:hypothetical protein WILE_72 [Mycobacterium phage Wile]YP_009635484.1 hypothetical protein FGG52_gp71 [Mycobacterium phage Backyardigan]YP_010062803.1 hypothetical protein KIY72_gp73 [Mycobacterium phage Wizard007]YP_010063065.1 hypothetical protein KIY75_gp74 [Mycobacterium phage Noelle]AOT27579.1 hypothetical protein SEA_BADGER_72 [Mycobacterium phage Badger]APD17420.1 hypothetical protein PBI_ACHEBE_72 [Mycobacterium phage Achebe]ASZ73706.1 hypothetical protein SEA_MORPHER26_73 [Mycobac
MKLTASDIAYRKALGIEVTDPLPAELGSVTRRANRLKRPRKTARFR